MLRSPPTVLARPPPAVATVPRRRSELELLVDDRHRHEVAAAAAAVEQVRAEAEAAAIAAAAAATATEKARRIRLERDEEEEEEGAMSSNSALTWKGIEAVEQYTVPHLVHLDSYSKRSGEVARPGAD